MNKFDETIERILNNEDYGAFGMDVDTVIGIVEDLRKEYAPRVEMTFEEYTTFDYYAKHSSFFSLIERKHAQDYLEISMQKEDEFNNLSDEDLMQAWLHPDTIKVINK